MKSRVGKLEGELRTNKRLRESMDKHIRMLENALRKRNVDQAKITSPDDDKAVVDTQQDGNAKQRPNPNGK